MILTKEVVVHWLTAKVDGLDRLISLLDHVRVIYEHIRYLDK